MIRDTPEGQTQYDSEEKSMNESFEELALRVAQEMAWLVIPDPVQSRAFALRIRDELCKGQEPVGGTSALSAGLGVVLPPLTLTKPLTVVMYPDGSKAEVDAAIEAIKNGDTYFRCGISEMFFHNLRLRIALDPALEKLISVLYATPGGYKQVGLGDGDELHWPVGFCQEAWETESAIQEARETTPNVEEA